MDIAQTDGKKLGVTYKLQFAAFAVVLLIIGVQTGRNIGSARQRNETETKQNLIALHKGFNEEVALLERTAAALSLSFSQCTDIQERFHARDRQGMLALLEPTFSTLQTDYDIVHLQFHEPSGHIFLRVHDPERYGDYTFAYRRANALAIVSRQTVAGVEIDPNRLGIQGVSPVFQQGQFVGLVEVGLDYDQTLIENLKARSGADYKMWVNYQDAEPAGLGPVDDAPESPSSEFFYYAGTDPTSLPVPSEVYNKVLQGGEPQIRFVSVGDQESAVLVAPMLGYGDRIIGILEISISRAEALAALQKDQLTTLGWAGGFAGLGLVLVWLITHIVVLRPLRHLTMVAQQQLAGDLLIRVELLPRDEFGQLGHTLNVLSGKLNDTLQDQEKIIAERTTELVETNQRLEREIVERKRAEEARRESEQRYRALFENAPVGFGLTTLDGRIRACNDALLQMAGYSEEEMLRINVRDTYQDPEERMHLLEQLEADGFVRNYEAVLKRKDGTSYHASLTMAPITLSGEENLLAVVEDTTERKQAEEALQRSEEHFRALIENASDIIMILNADATIRYGSPSIGRWFGYEPEEFIGRTPSEFVHLDDLSMIMEALSRAIQNPGVALPIEFRLRHKDGSWRVVEAIGNNLLEEPAVNGIVINIRDVTERKQAEEALREQTHALRESEELLNNILTASSVGIAHSKDRNIIWANEAMVSLFGFTAEEQYLGKGTNILYPSEEEYRRVGRIIYEQQRAGRVVELDTKFKRQDGSLFDGYLRINALDPLDPIKGVIVSIIDITERKQAEEERSRLLVQIQEQARRVEQIMDTVPEGVLLLDADGLVVLANPMAEGYLGVLADAKVGDTLTHLGDRPLAELLAPPPKRLWHEAKANGRTFEIVARPMRNGPGPKEWVLVINDVTQEREIQQRVQQQERLAAVGQLAAGIAHDFNNIMASIVLYAQMTARTKGLSATIQERMETINQQAKHATDLIQQILDFGRRAVLERRPLDLLPLLKEQVKLLERTLPENIEIELDYGPDEDSALFIVHADPTRMQQIVTNLAVNARDAMPQGGSLRIELKRIRVEGRKTAPLPEMEVGDWVQVTVSDTGVGIPSDVLPRIYEPFFTTKAPLGSGLGLAQVHGIVAQHGGCIDVETQLGQGTTFTIYLPALQVHQPEELPQETTYLAQGQGQMILVVEDNAVARRALMESLELLNYRVLEASNGQQALEVLQRRAGEADRDVDQIALVLSDMVMPGMGGVALFHALQEKYPQVRLVLLTGHPLVDELKDLSAQGLSGWLLKPPSLEQLAKVIARALRDT